MRYGVEGGMLKEGGRGASTWWRELAALRREGWFGDHVSRYEENGKNTFFFSVGCVVSWCVIQGQV